MEVTIPVVLSQIEADGYLKENCRFEHPGSQATARQPANRYAPLQNTDTRNKSYQNGGEKLPSIAYDHD